LGVPSQPLTASDLSLIAPSLAAFPFKPYRHYRAYSRKAQNAILQAEVTSALQLAPHLGFRAGDEERHALVIARPLTWDSEFFGVRMARIDYLIAGPGAAPHLASALDATLAACREAAIPHVTARVDVEDVGAVDLLQRRGFRLMDALVTYRIRPPKLEADARDVGVIRDFEARDSDPVMEIAREAFAGYVGRFQHDPHVPADRAEEFYLEWTRKGLSGEMADKLFVSVNSEDTVIGFLFFRRREPASTAGGVPIYGGGLGACRRDSPGAYAGLIRAGARWAEDQGSVAECQTQNYNFPVIRVYEAAGGTYVRAEYTLHAWLGA
jgi:hypothetical protein